MRLLMKFIPQWDYDYYSIYKHKIQGFIYSLLKDETRINFDHENKQFKFFTFNDIFPVGKIRKNKPNTLIVSSPNKKFIYELERNIDKEQTYHLSGCPIKVYSTKVIELPLRDTFITGSPIVLYHDHKENEYFSFEKHKNLSFFMDRLKENGIKKYRAYKQNDFEMEENLFDKMVFNKEVVVINEKDKSKFIHIGSTWKILKKEGIKKGYRDFYDFIMECGLGEKNSMGFGFINPKR